MILESIVPVWVFIFTTPFTSILLSLVDWIDVISMLLSSARYWIVSMISEGAALEIKLSIENSFEFVTFVSSPLLVSVPVNFKSVVNVPSPS